MRLEISPQDLINDIIEVIDSKQTVLFCGAGISINSGMPAADAFVLNVLKQLGFSQSEEQEFGQAKLPFEAFIAILRESHDISTLLSIYDNGQPSNTHRLIAELMKLEKLQTVCTTNFDRLLDDAIKSTVDCEVIYETSSMGTINLKDTRKRLIKLHGSIDDQNSLAITLDQVASRLLSEQRRRVIEEVFSTGAHQNVLLLGYSCSDVFDISPAIEAIDDSNKTIFFIQHCSKSKPNQRRSVCVEDIVDKDEKNPFKNFSGGKRFFCDTDDLVSAIWEHFIGKRIPLKKVNNDDSNTNECIWEQRVEQWVQELKGRAPKAEMFNIKGRILTNISANVAARECFEKAMKFAREEDDMHVLSVILGNLANMYIRKGETVRGIVLLNQALKLSKEIDDKEGMVRHLISLSDAHERRNECKTALECAFRGIQIAKDNDYKQMMGTLHTVCGVNLYCLGKKRSGMQHLHEAVTIHEDNGDIPGLLNALLAFGIVIENRDMDDSVIENRDMDDSVTENLNKALDTAVRFGNNVLIAVARGYVGIDLICKGEKEKGLKYCEQSLRFLEPILGADHAYIRMLKRWNSVSVRRNVR